MSAEWKEYRIDWQQIESLARGIAGYPLDTANLFEAYEKIISGKKHTTDCDHPEFSICDKWNNEIEALRQDGGLYYDVLYKLERMFFVNKLAAYSHLTSKKFSLTPNAPNELRVFIEKVEIEKSSSAKSQKGHNIPADVEEQYKQFIESEGRKPTLIKKISSYWLTAQGKSNREITTELNYATSSITKHINEGHDLALESGLPSLMEFFSAHRKDRRL